MILAQKVIVYGDLTYTNKAAVKTQLDTFHGSNAVGAVHTADLGLAAQAAHEWAITNRVPMVPMGARLDAEGYIDPPARRLRLMNFANADSVVAAGPGAGAAHISALATSRGKTLAQI